MTSEQAEQIIELLVTLGEFQVGIMLLLAVIGGAQMMMLLLLAFKARYIFR